MDKGWGLWSGAGRGLGDDGGLDQGYELVLGMRLCAQCWEYRGEQQSGDVCMVGQTWKHTDIFSVHMTQKAAYTEYQCCMEGGVMVLLEGRRTLPTS